MRTQGSRARHWSRRDVDIGRLVSCLGSKAQLGIVPICSLDGAKLGKATSPQTGDPHDRAFQASPERNEQRQ
jgi:hypothetical protein